MNLENISLIYGFADIKDLTEPFSSLKSLFSFDFFYF